MYPSIMRRIAVVVLYNLALVIAVGVLIVTFVTNICWFYNECTASDDVRLQWILFIWMAAAVASVVLGWRGGLWGASSKRPHG